MHFEKKYVFHSPRSVYVWKNYAFSPEYRPLPTAAGGIEDLGHSFFQYVPSGWWITYIYAVWTSGFLSFKQKIKLNMVPADWAFFSS